MLKEDLNLSSLVRRHITDIEKQFIELKMEKIRLDREKTSMIFNKGLMLYFSFIVLGVYGVTTHVMDQYTLYTLIIVGMFLLILVVVPYLTQIQKAEKELNGMLDYLMHERGEMNVQQKNTADK